MNYQLSYKTNSFVNAPFPLQKRMSAHVWFESNLVLLLHRAAALYNNNTRLLSNQTCALICFWSGKDVLVLELVLYDSW